MANTIEILSSYNLCYNPMPVKINLLIIILEFYYVNEFTY